MKNQNWKEGPFHQIDFILTPNRWKNCTNNAYSDPDAMVDSDHFPVIAENVINFSTPKAPAGGGTEKFDKPQSEENIAAYNLEINTYLMAVNNAQQTNQPHGLPQEDRNPHDRSGRPGPALARLPRLARALRRVASFRRRHHVKHKPPSLCAVLPRCP